MQVTGSTHVRLPSNNQFGLHLSFRATHNKVFFANQD